MARTTPTPSSSQGLQVAMYFSSLELAYWTGRSLSPDDDDSDKMWWQKPELSKEKKMERMRAAERDVKFDISNRKFLLQNKAKALPYNRSYQKHDRDYGSYQKRPQFPQGRPDTRRCHWCQGVGHIARNCPVKSQQQQQPPFRNPSQLGFGKSKTGN